MKPLLLTGLVIVVGLAIFAGVIASRIMGKDVVKEPTSAPLAEATTQGATAQHRLQFRMVIPSTTVDLAAVALPMTDHSGKDLRVGKILMDEREVESVSGSTNGAYAINLNFTKAGAQRFANITSQNIHQRMAIVLDGTILAAPVIISPMSSVAQIVGPAWSEVHRDKLISTLREAINPSTNAPAAGPLGFVVKDIDGHDYDLFQLHGKVVMFVNVASKCGFTPQYEGLEETYLKYKDRGFVIVGFPANNFGHQEPGTNEQIKQFCVGKYNVTFPMMSKISVKGDDQHPLYKTLTDPASDGDFAGPITWNFNKFLIDRSGHVYARFASKTKPTDAIVTGAIEKGLGE